MEGDLGYSSLLSSSVPELLGSPDSSVLICRACHWLVRRCQDEAQADDGQAFSMSEVLGDATHPWQTAAGPRASLGSRLWMPELKALGRWAPALPHSSPSFP